LWQAYRQCYGFDVDRIEWAVARAGAAMTGGRARDLIPQFIGDEDEPESTPEEFIAALDRLGKRNGGV
jgi:hypothetical protein